jgi:predicted nicotinamide N-methyase
MMSVLFQVWPAAVVLMKYLERRFGANGMQGKRVIDIGSGTGVVGLAAAILGAEVILSDQEQILFLAEQNVATCKKDYEGQELSVSVAKYDWGNEVDISALNPPFDFVLVSECVLPKLYPIPPLVDAIAEVSGPNTIVLVAYEHRLYEHFDPPTKFKELMAEKKFGMVTITEPDLDPHFVADDIHIWELKQ